MHDRTPALTPEQHRAQECPSTHCNRSGECRSPSECCSPGKRTWGKPEAVKQ
jgi:hypothetical protein